MGHYLLGTDPEFFLVHKESGRPVPAHRHFPGKDAKRKVTEYTTVFRDGYAMELNVTPFGCRETAANEVYKGLNAVVKALPADLRLVSTPMVEINLGEDLADAPEDVLTFGCEPSWTAYGGDMQSVALDALTHPFRYAGGHLHLGITKSYLPESAHYMKHSYIREAWARMAWMKNAEAVQLFIRMCDLYIGLPLSYWFEKPETFARRKYYGKAGEFRYQEYGKRDENGAPDAIGVEYRTPGPEVWNAPPVNSFALGTMRTIAEHFDTLCKTWDAGVEDDVRAAINTGVGMRGLMRAFTHFQAFLPRMFDTAGLLANRPFQQLLLVNTEAVYNKHGQYFGSMGMDYLAAVKGDVTKFLP